MFKNGLFISSGRFTHKISMKFEVVGMQMTILQECKRSNALN